MVNGVCGSPVIAQRLTCTIHLGCAYLERSMESPFAAWSVRPRGLHSKVFRFFTLPCSVSVCVFSKERIQRAKKTSEDNTASDFAKEEDDERTERQKASGIFSAREVI